MTTYLPRKSTRGVITSGVITEDLISDLFPVFALVKSSSPACQKSYVRKRKVTAGRIEKLRDELANVAWSNIKTGNTNTSYNELIKIYMGLVDKHIPIRHVKQKEDTTTYKPWLTKGIKISCATFKGLKGGFKGYRRLGWCYFTTSP